MKFLMAHWELKVVAIVLAVALWIYTSGQVRSERSLNVQLRSNLVTGLGDSYRITSITPSEFRVTLSVPTSRSEAMPEMLTPHLAVRAESLASLEQSFPITSSTLGLASDVRILRTEPDNFREIIVKWDAIVSFDLLVEPPELINVPKGMDADVKLDRTIVRVRAGNNLIDRSQKVRFQPIDLGKITDPMSAVGQEQRVTLRKVSGLSFDIEQEVGAAITLKPVPGSMVLTGVPVQVLMSREDAGKYLIDLAPPQVSLTVHGPENLLKSFKPSTDLTAYVDLRGATEQNDARDVPVVVLGPAWLTADLVTVRANLVLAKQIGSHPEIAPTDDPAPRPTQPPTPSETPMNETSPAPAPEAGRPPPGGDPLSPKDAVELGRDIPSQAAP